MEKIFDVIPQVKDPITLAALLTVVLPLIIQQILKILEKFGKYNQESLKTLNNRISAQYEE